jgi:hypothetical protein
MAKHTPGPWHTDGVVVWASDDGGNSFDVPVCVVTSRSENGLSKPAENAPTCGLENASLIAAAPELLGALKRIHTASNDQVTRAMAAEAIAKAEGR